MLPESILRRRTKSGFETPQGQWLRGPLRTIVESCVASDGPVWAYANRHYVRSQADAAWSGRVRGEETEQEVMRVVFLDRWLREFIR
jgi:hypothetical protein